MNAKEGETNSEYQDIGILYQKDNTLIGLGQINRVFLSKFLEGKLLVSKNNVIKGTEFGKYRAYNEGWYNQRDQPRKTDWGGYNRALIVMLRNNKK